MEYNLTRIKLENFKWILVLKHPLIAYCCIYQEINCMDIKLKQQSICEKNEKIYFVGVTLISLFSIYSILRPTRYA